MSQKIRSSNFTLGGGGNLVSGGFSFILLKAYYLIQALPGLL